MTRQAVANAVDQPLEFRPELMRQIEEKFARFNAKMTDNNRLQAMMPRNAITIDNQVGTAPAFIVETETGAIISLPGVPREMKYLMEHAVMPYLERRAGVGVIKLRVLRTAGAGESWVGEQINDLMRLNNPTVGTAAHSGFCDVRITAKASTEAEADAMIAELEHELRRRIGEFIFGVDKDPLEGALVNRLREMDLTIACSETGTSGALRKRLLTYPTAADVLVQTEEFDTVDEVRAHLGAPADETLAALADQAVKKLLANSPAAIAIGIVSNDSETIIAVTMGAITRSRAYAYGGIDAGGPEWATGWGISMAWRVLGESRAEAQH
jgi:hypothetical protein